MFLINRKIPLVEVPTLSAMRYFFAGFLSRVGTGFSF